MNEEFIIYESKGQKTFECPLQLSYIEELKVFIDAILVSNTEYTLEEFGEDGQKVVFHQIIGTVNNPVTVLLKKDVLVKRQTCFDNISQIRADILNVELDNVFRNQTYFKNILDKTVVSLEGEYLFLPKAEEGKTLLWSNNQLSNSFYNIDETLSTLVDFMNTGGIDFSGITANKVLYSHGSNISNVKEALDDLFNNQGSGGGEGGGGAIENIHASKVIYEKTDLSISNAEQGFNYLIEKSNNIITLPIDSKDITVIHDNIDGTTLQDAVNQLSESAGILYSNTSSHLENATSVQTAIDSLNKKLDDFIAKQSSNNEYNGALHIIISGPIGTDATSNHIIYKSAKIVSVDCSKTPLSLCFSNNNKKIIQQYSGTSDINFTELNKKYYIYADLMSNNISFGYTDKTPSYLCFNTLISKALLWEKDSYIAGADFFHIPTMTMYNSSGQAINRLYIGQVEFNDSGAIKYLNNYCHGDYYSCNLQLKANAFTEIPNRIGNNVIFTNITSQLVIPSAITTTITSKNQFATHSPIRNPTKTDESLEGLEYSFTESVIQIYFPSTSDKTSSHYLGDGPGTYKAPLSCSDTNIRVVIKRAF